MMKIICFLVSFFFLTLGSSYAQISIMKNDADSLVMIGKEQIYNSEFEKASITFKELINRYPDHPSGYFLDAMNEWWKIWLYKHQESFDDTFLEKIDKVIEVCEEELDVNETDLKSLFFKGAALGYRGRYHVIRKNWLRAVRDGKDAFDILNQCHEIAPGNHDIMLGTGLYEYFAAAFPEKYPTVKPLVKYFPPGDKKLGILQLEAAAKKARYASVESEVVLLQIYYQFEKNYTKAYELAKSLNERYPKNSYFQRYVGKSYMIQNRKKEADSIWRDILMRYIRKETGYDVYTARESLYYIGYLLFIKRDLKMSEKYFKKCVQASEKIDDTESGFQVKALLYLAKIYDLKGKRNKAKELYEKVLDSKEYDATHKQAERYLNKAYGK